MVTKQKVISAWVARDKSGDIYLYNLKPKKDELLEIWEVIFGDNYNRIKPSNLPEGINPQWEDEEPIEVELIIRSKE